MGDGKHLSRNKWSAAINGPPCASTACISANEDSPSFLGLALTLALASPTLVQLGGPVVATISGLGDQLWQP